MNLKKQGLYLAAFIMLFTNSLSTSPTYKKNHPGTYEMVSALPYDVLLNYQFSHKPSKNVKAQRNIGKDVLLERDGLNTLEFIAKGKVDWIKVRRADDVNAISTDAIAHTRLNDGLCKFRYGKKGRQGFSKRVRNSSYHLQKLTLNEVAGRYVIGHECIKALQ